MSTSTRRRLTSEWSAFLCRSEYRTRKIATLQIKLFSRAPKKLVEAINLSGVQAAKNGTGRFAFCGHPARDKSI
jgi:hypothetical protein